MKSIKIVPRGVAERSNEASGIRGECLSLMNMRERNDVNINAACISCQKRGKLEHLFARAFAGVGE